MSNRQEILANTDYEPYDNRNKEDGTNRVETLINLLKGSIGTGILAMPDAFRNAGLITGTVGVIVIVFLVTYCFHLMFSGMYFFCKRDKIPATTFPEALKKGLQMGPKCLQKWAGLSPYVVDFFIIFFQVGCLTVYFVFSAENIKEVIDFNTAKENRFRLQIYIIFMFVPFLLICYVKKYKQLVPISVISNWLVIICLICIFYLVFEKTETIEDRKLFVHISTFPLFVSTTLFTTVAMGPMLSLEHNMKDGRYFVEYFGTLNQAMIIVGILNLITGFFGYWKYGEKTAPMIIFNTDVSNRLAQSIRVLYSIAIWASVGLQAYPGTEIIWEHYVEKCMESSQHKMIWNYVIRTILVLIAFLLAIGIPKIGLAIALIGSFCLSMLCMIFPALLDICVRWPDDFGKLNVILVRNIFLIIIGVACWFFGNYTAILNIVLSLRGSPN